MVEMDSSDLADQKLLSTTDESATAEKGLAVEAAAVNGTKPHAAVPPKAEADCTADTQEQPEPAEWQQRMWFVKMPKPPEDSAALVLEQEHDAYRTQLNMLASMMKVERTKRDAVEANRRAADATLQKCRQALAEKDAELKPIQLLREKRSTLLEEVASYRDLTVKSDVELDNTVVTFERRIEQESLTLNEEKQLMQTVKKLKLQRERVKDYMVKAAQLAAVREEIKAAEAALDSVQSDRRALVQELETAKAIKAKYVDEERALREVMDDLGRQRQSAKEQRDAAWERLMEHKTPKQEKAAHFYGNRKFSKDVRDLLAAGEIAEARSRCAAQMDEMIAKYSHDAAFRAEYVRMFDLQRPRKFMLEGDEVNDQVDMQRGGKSRPQDAAAQPVAIDPEAARKRAEALIAETLAQVSRGSAAAATPATTAATSLTAAAVPAQPAAAVKKPVKSKQPVVKEAVLPQALQAEDKFELPAYIQESKKDASAASAPVSQQHIREDRAAAAAELAARKEKRKQQAEKRRLEREAAEAAAREAKQQEHGTVHATAELSEADHVAEKTTAEDIVPGNTILSQASKRSSRPGGKNPMTKGVSVARARKRKTWWQQYQLYVYIALAVLLVVIVALLAFLMR